LLPNLVDNAIALEALASEELQDLAILTNEEKEEPKSQKRHITNLE